MTCTGQLGPVDGRCEHSGEGVLSWTLHTLYFVRALDIGFIQCITSVLGTVRHASLLCMRTLCLLYHRMGLGASYT
jgi:hypothetical protein